MLRTGDRGRPQLVGGASQSSPSFSLSHTRDVVACAVGARGLIGIDVEAVDPTANMMRIARDNFMPREIETLDGCVGAARISRFYELWTLKEALFKATGLPPEALLGASFEFSGRGEVRLHPCRRCRRTSGRA